MALFKDLKVLGLADIHWSLAAKAQQGCPGQSSLVNLWIKPASSYTALWLKGSGIKYASMSPATN